MLNSDFSIFALAIRSKQYKRTSKPTYPFLLSSSSDESEVSAFLAPSSFFGTLMSSGCGSSASIVSLEMGSWHRTAKIYIFTYQQAKKNHNIYFVIFIFRLHTSHPSIGCIVNGSRLFLTYHRVLYHGINRAHPIDTHIYAHTNISHIKTNAQRIHIKLIHPNKTKIKKKQ